MGQNSGRVCMLVNALQYLHYLDYHCLATILDAD
jgi:hypothetical protein